ncbi:MAG: twin-arginine translocase subunit TatC [Bacteroidales bacterium]|nr:twin-arginine translocase subunit TatC [Bacteroidales bacterium]
MTFWDHLEELRMTIFRSLLFILVFAVVAFCFKGILFDKLIFAPLSPSFITYRLLGLDLSMKLINVEISSQFFVHMSAAAATGLVVAFPFVIYELWRFIAPALYDSEIRSVRGAFLLASGLFYFGVAVGFFIVLPLCLEFFVNYSVSSIVDNNITLSSYMSLFYSLVIVIGLVFEFPMLITILSAMDLVHRDGLRKYRKHAIVAVLVISAIITPADPLSMIILAIPLYLLFEFSVILCRK